LLEEIVRYDSDIICLQEADFYEDIKHYLHYLGYMFILLKSIHYRVKSQKA
jgi:mRNA deadenylase 3'-5' endonuclease subunit Ccr4